MHSFELSGLVLCLIFFNSALSSTTTENPTTSLDDQQNDTVPQDLYVIKTIVYEVGILTDVGNDTDQSNETHEQVDLTFFDPKHNGSLIDLSHIPVPIQTNVSGVSLTGILPGANLGQLLLPPVNNTPLLPNKQISVTQNISTSDPDTASEIISNLPKLLGLTSKNQSKDDDVDE